MLPWVTRWAHEAKDAYEKEGAEARVPEMSEAMPLALKMEHRPRAKGRSGS